jgi:hypothetical protein
MNVFVMGGLESFVKCMPPPFLAKLFVIVLFSRVGLQADKCSPPALSQFNHVLFKAVLLVITLFETIC